MARYAALLSILSLVAATGCSEHPHEGVGSDGIFRITPQRPVSELRAETLAAQPPAESGEFRSVDLVELTTLDPTIKLDIRYATANNTGKAVSMPSVYDEMSPRAYPTFTGGKPAEREHRELLRQAMEREGFTVYDTEWWHFDFKDWREYPIGNRDFDG